MEFQIEDRHSGDLHRPMTPCPSKEIFDEGLCIGVYDMFEEERTFRFRDEELTISFKTISGGPHRSVHYFEYKGWPVVARWEDVKRCSEV